MRRYLQDEPGPTATVEVVRVTAADVDLLSVTGTLDMVTCPQLEETLYRHIDAPPHRVCLDMSAVDFMDSSGLHLLLKASMHAGTYDQNLYLAHPSKAVTRVIELAGVGTLLPSSTGLVPSERTVDPI